MALTKNFHLSCVCVIVLAYYTQAQNKTNGTTSTNNTQVPLLDINQILKIANPVRETFPNQTTVPPVVNLTTTTASVVNLATTIATTTTSPLAITSTTGSTTPLSTPSTLTTISVTTPTTTTTQVTTPNSTTTTTTTTTESTSSTTVSANSIEIETTEQPTSTGAPEALSESSNSTIQPSTSETVPSSTQATAHNKLSVLPENPTLFSEYNASQSAPEPLRESTTVKPTTTTTTTTTTKAPEPIRVGQVVKITQGDLRPAVLRSRQGRKYYAFRGVRYANPPVHFQRFKMPAPVAPWSDVLIATSYGPSCIQYNILTGNVEGEEDCLTLVEFKLSPSIIQQFEAPTIR